MKKRIMLIGPTGCGKTTLAHALDGVDRPLRRTQEVIYGPKTIDTPGAYVENAWMYSHLIATAQNASHILIMVDQSRRQEVYPPGFADSFTRPVVGVITKADLVPENEKHCVQVLERIGIAEPFFRISFPRGTGIEQLKCYLSVNQKV
ncbi:EutP/PduV family microcompartment system protein [Paenibacillus faecalis]|uniref:EutP/PduV family microcompartment system protein n=1 Tax=Paenibacillus faecalis TaxID=2079532 RepID=UPI000D0FAC62|nr:EutP/PduV family microcompartment system protein [Paenibacillus faecalis]